jgi:hypothetical protein
LPPPSEEQRRKPLTFTAVTALVDVGRASRVSQCEYLDRLFSHLARDINLVIFVEEWAADFVRTVRSRLGLLDKTDIHVLTRDSEMVFWPLFQQMQVRGIIIA